MERLADFLNHGLLPFSGRDREIERIVAFWRGTLRGEAMGCMLMVGEAGIGKSRLIQEGIARIEKEGGAVVHIKLYPESTAAIAPLAAQALWKSRSGRHLLRSEPEGNLSSVSEALRRFAHLRPTLLVVEDVHLLQRSTLKEFTGLLGAISDEPLALLCVARPVELSIKGVLERWPLEEMILGQLGNDEISAIWQELFGNIPTNESLRDLAESTLGNALAIRSALRGALREEALVQRSDGSWIGDGNFARVVARAATSLTEGMIAHLADSDREAAGHLSSLGELFSREAAESMVERSSIENLLYSGILHETTFAKPPIPGLPKSADPPLAFTHSLIHRGLLESATPAVDPLLQIVAEGTPLYSILPYELLRSIAEPSPLPIDVVASAVVRIVEVAHRLDMTSDWEEAPGVLAVTDRLLAQNSERFGEEIKRELRARILAARLVLMRRTLYTEEHADVTAELLATTRHPSSLFLAEFHLIGLMQLMWSRARQSFQEYAAVLPEIEETLRQFPELRSLRQYIMLLSDQFRLAKLCNSSEELRRCEKEYNALVASNTLSDQLRQLALERIAPELLSLFDTAEELKQRIELLNELRSLDVASSSIYVVSETGFLAEVGRIDELMIALDRGLPLLKGWGMMLTWCYRSLMRLWGEGMLGLDLEDVALGVARVDGLGYDRHYINYAGFTYPISLGFLLGDWEWTRRMFESYIVDPANGMPHWWLLFALRGYIPIEEILRLCDEKPYNNDIRSLIEGVGAGEQMQGDSVIAAARAILEAPLLRWDQLLNVVAVIEFRDAVRPSYPDVAASLQSDICTALMGAFTWLSDRRLNVPMESFLVRFADDVEPKQRTSLRKLTAHIAAAREGERTRGGSHDGRVLLSMLGKIEARSNNSSEATQPSGPRQKAFLGAMVVREMLERPLERDDFLEAVGIESDNPRLARDAVNSAIYRLRDLVGRDVIISDGETPRLNLDRVRVDLLEAHHYLHEAERAAQRGMLGQAQIALVRSMEITRGEVPFPTLYANLFEAMRDEFENRLRSVVIDIARCLIHESDTVGAERLLASAFTALPDEEIADLYCNTLESLGKRVEVERVRGRIRRDS